MRVVIGAKRGYRPNEVLRESMKNVASVVPDDNAINVSVIAQAPNGAFVTHYGAELPEGLSFHILRKHFGLS